MHVCVCICIFVCIFMYFMGSGTHIDVEAQRGHSRGLAQRQHHEQQAGQQLHHVEQVVVGEQVCCQGLGVARVGEKLVIVLAFLWGAPWEAQKGVGVNSGAGCGRATQTKCTEYGLL